MDGNGRVSEAIKEEGGLLPKGDVIKSGLLESGMGELDDRDDFVTMGLKGEALVEDGAEVEKFGDLGDGEGRGVWREVTGEDPRVCCTGAALGGGFVEDDDLERGDCQTVTVTGGLGRMEETLHGRSCVGDKTKVVDVEKDSKEGHGERVRESQVGMVTLDGVDEVGDVDSPKDGRKTTAFRQAFEDVDVGVAFSVNPSRIRYMRE